jgi:histone H3/H4
VKVYIKEKGDMKTSSSVLSALSERIRTMCDEAIESARSDGRKTVLDRDIG